jgi:hypothetical protein
MRVFGGAGGLKTVRACSKGAFNSKNLKACNAPNRRVVEQVQF